MYHRHPDPAYNSFSITGLPTTRNSVRHIREANPNPLGPRTFIPANRYRDPLWFVRTTEKQQFGFYFHPPLAYRYHYSYRGDKPSSFYFQQLSACRDKLSTWYGGISAKIDRTIPVSRVPIFKLPEFCVQRVLSYLEDSDLTAFALVDRDCLQLARARLFRSVLINYSAASMALLETLVGEGSDRVANKFPHDQPKWTLGACISRISLGFESRPKEEETSWVDGRMRSYNAVAYHQRHMNLLELALRVALPNLEFLDWWDRIPIGPLMAHAIIESKITRLELHCVNLSKDFDVCGSTESERKVNNGRDWQLRRLVLHVRTGNWGSCAPIFTASLLKLVAPTLEELVWEGDLFKNEEKPEAHSFGTDLVSFKNLKKLYLTRVPLADDTIMSAFLVPDSKLTHLFFNSPESKLAPALASRGHISTLKYLNWNDVTPDNDIDHFISFLTANPQLETFRTEDTTVKLLDDHLVPLFASSFHSLTSLAFVFDTAKIAPESLALIGTIVTLKHLWLSAGIQWSASFDWYVDHDSLRENLASLKQLEWFALTLDLYPNGNKQHPLTLAHPPMSQKWENSHGRLMARHAMEFAKLHPSLTWVYFGHVPMEIERAEDGSGEVIDAVSLVEKRKGCERLLNEMWGAESVDWVYST